ncbi:6-hydroxymethylpterin diphosphokinase MptE-like protein [Mucilaginibacter sp. P25]|uniref:6-hydroxymethylpterin diphosphokinase MptE-like domain-containing protein n=1 Tax=Mucilaginibacter gossypii TaxID=551996 RepID=A0A1G7WF57_9SPHI|nr:6-hydroxymethylpterin diphosphokinase MptE-like protein [Mucilaginibacter gossypii]SDG70601.1 Protein of unknown function DUF115 [Mucilaginibacter gossypii]
MEGIKRLLSFKLSDLTFGRVSRALLRRVGNIWHLATWYFPFGFSKRNKEKIKQYENIHAGKRCFIVCNGPGLNKINIDLLKNEYTIGMNRIYLMEEQNGFSPTYLFCYDKATQLLQFTEEFDALKLPCFFNWDLNKKFSRKDNQVFLKGKFSPSFSIDPIDDLVGNGKTVTYICMQLAYYMGFSEVYLVGKDHSYNTTVKPTNAIVSDGHDLNHFSPKYYRPGQIWDAPDYHSEELAYKLARKVFEQSGRKIQDASVDGKLDVFEKVDFKELFTENIHS